MAGGHINLCSYNCNGLGDHLKRKDIFDYLRTHNFDICLLQETHLLASQENFIRSCWGFEVVLAGNSTNSNGVAILFSNSFDFKILNCLRDTNGRYIFLDLELENNRIHLINIYAPSTGDHPDFFEKIYESLENMRNDKVIIAGDWNCILDEQIDCKNYLSTNHKPLSREKIKSIIRNFELNDIWRSLNKDKQEFTWRKFRTLKQARLDYFLVSESLIPIVNNSKIEAKYRSDHSIISLSIKKKEFTRDRAHWKFNKSLLKNKEYLEIVKNTIQEVKKDYCALVYNFDKIDTIDNEQLNLRIGDQLFFEILLMKIRGKTISFSCFIKKRETERQEYLIGRIENLEKNIDNDNLEEIETLKNELANLRNKKIEGMNIRSKATWIKEGEKGTKYFTNLERRNYVNKAMPTLVNNLGQEIHSQREIAQEVRNYYENLYKRRITEDVNLEDILPDDIPKLSDQKKHSIQGALTLEELKYTLKEMKNDKSPGTDGFTVEFFKFFFINIGIFLLRSINEGYLNGELSVTQKQGIITCIPKENKEKKYLKNWRPITLLNISYKIAAGCIANRIKSVLSDIINECQKGFLKGRYIGENIRLIYDLMFYADKHNIPGLLLSIDYQKAFDSVSWSFLEKALVFFNFGEDILRWFKILYTNATATTFVNGQYSTHFRIERGVRQGDPLSPYLYLIGAEILSIMLRRNKEIKGIKINNREYLLSQFADDTALCLDGSKTSFEATIDTLDKFSSMSGLVINNEKTQIMWFGSEKNSKKRYMRDRNFTWDPGIIKILGINFSIHLDQINEINYRGKINEIESLLNIWSKRNLTPFGKVLVLKMLAIPKLLYLFLNLQDPSEHFIITLENLMYKFIWDNKPSKIDKKTLKKDYDEGGIKMIDIRKFLTTLKISWLHRLLENENFKKFTFDLNPEIRKLFFHGSEIESKIYHKLNPFWKHVVKHYKILDNSYTPKTIDDFLSEFIFGNKSIRRGGKAIFHDQLVEKGVFRIGDLINNEHKFMTYREFHTNYLGSNIDFLTYQGYISAIKTYLNRCGLALNEEEDRGYLEVHDPNIWQIIKKGKFFIKNQLKTENNFNHVAMTKWNNLYNNINWQKIFIELFQTSNDTKLKWFEFRIIYRILPTNRYLYQRNLKDTALCNFCNDTNQTISHLLWSCDQVQIFWLRVQDRLHDCENFKNQYFNEELIILGRKEGYQTDDILNLIILIGKYYIFLCKIQDTLPTWNQFKPYIKNRIDIEKITREGIKYDKFEKVLKEYQNFLL